VFLTLIVTSLPFSVPQALWIFWVFNTWLRSDIDVSDYIDTPAQKLLSPMLEIFYVALFAAAASFMFLACSQRLGYAKNPGPLSRPPPQAGWQGS
jgi:hypothetical protein